MEKDSAPESIGSPFKKRGEQTSLSDTAKADVYNVFDSTLSIQNIQTIAESLDELTQPSRILFQEEEETDEIM